MTTESGVERNELVAYLDDLLEADRTDDLSPNGLQVEGAEIIHRVVTGVSSCHELFRKAGELAAEAVLVHHGLFWRGDPPTLTGFRKRRIEALFAGDMNLIAYHLPLDRHRRYGNNALAAEGLGLSDLEEFGSYEGAWIGYKGRFDQAIGAEELAERCEALFGQRPQLFGDSATPVRTVGIISGAAQREFHSAIEQRLDAYITGEVSEWVMNVAREAGVLYLAAGHYATEHLGVRALGDHIASHFGIEVHFVDVPNPV